MFSQLLKIISLTKGIATFSLAAAVATGAVVSNVGSATTLDHVASPTPTTPSTASARADVDAFVQDCLKKATRLKELREASSEEYAAQAKVTSEACRRAMEATGLDEKDFWARFGPRAEPTAKTSPAATPTVDSQELKRLVKDCFAKYAAAKDATGDAAAELARVAKEACLKAIEASGLTPEEFWARFGPKASAKPSASPKTTELGALVKDCVEKYEKLLRSEQTDQIWQAAKDACQRALAASGLTPDQFWAKIQPLIHRPPKPSEMPKTGELAPLVKECLEKYAKLSSLKDAPAEVLEKARAAAKEACTRAIEASGLTADEFWAKFGPKAQPKPSASPRTAEVGALVKECLTKYAALTAMSDQTSEAFEKARAETFQACERAIAASGLMPQEFWAKFGAKR